MSWWDYPSKLAALVYVEYIKVIHVEVKLGSRLGTKETRSSHIVCLIKVPTCFVLDGCTSLAFS